MAEADSKGTSKEEPYLRGTFKIGKVLHDVSLSTTSLSWIKKGATANETVTIPIEEILGVTKKEAVGNAVVGFDIIWTKHKKKNVMRHKVVHFSSSSEEAEEWRSKIQSAIDKLTARPRKLLVLINPVSGNSKGRQIYKKKVAEIFSIANIQTDVEVTERAHHCEDILADYDLSSIDGIVLVGGDGLYHEATNGLQLRLMKEAGLDKNDSSISLFPLPLPMGIVPAGTGNGIAGGCFGTFDVETAALAIVIGKKQYNNLIAVHSNRELIVYSSLLVGYGMWGDTIYVAENRRHMGKMRYPVTILECFLLRSQRPMDLTVEYLPPKMKSKSPDKDNQPVKTSDMNPHRGAQTDQPGKTSDVNPHREDQSDQLVKTSDSNLHREIQSDLSSSEELGATGFDTKWETIQGTFISAIVFIGDVLMPSSGPDAPEPSEDCVTLLFNKPCSKMEMIGFMKKLFLLDPSFFLCEHVVHVPVKEYKLKLNRLSDPGSENRKLEHIINIDGEVCHLKTPEIYCRLHSKVVPLYSSGASKIYLRK